MLYSINEYAIASNVFAERQDRELFSLIHQWRHTATEFNRRLDITELRTFTNLSPQEIRLLYEALQELKEFNDALNLTQHITTFLKSKYPKCSGDSEVLTGASHICKYTRRLEIAATQTKSAYADSKNLKPTEVGFVCTAANSIR